MTYSTADIGQRAGGDPVPRLVVTQRTQGDLIFRGVSKLAGAGVFVILALIGIFLASGSPEQTGRLLDLLVAGVAASPR